MILIGDAAQHSTALAQHSTAGRTRMQLDRYIQARDHDRRTSATACEPSMRAEIWDRRPGGSVTDSSVYASGEKKPSGRIRAVMGQCFCGWMWKLICARFISCNGMPSRGSTWMANPRTRRGRTHTHTHTPRQPASKQCQQLTGGAAVVTAPRAQQQRGTTKPESCTNAFANN